MTSLLKRYWIRFHELPGPNPLNLGCGITALDKDDAIVIARNVVFRDRAIPQIVEIIENVDVAKLSKRVQPNIGDPMIRGVWFPLGYS